MGKTKQLLTALVGMALLAGCASRSDVRLARDEASQAQASANRALNSADAARSRADAADARSQRTEEMLNRVFKKSMRK
jgi:uncharacterized lipoprotein YajG